MRRYCLLCATLLVILAATCPRAARSATTLWQRFESTEGQFSVLFPGTPQISEKQMDTAAGPVTLYRFLAMDETTDETCVVMYCDYPKEMFPADKDPGWVLEPLLTATSRRMNFTVSSHKTLRWQDHPAIDAELESTEGVMSLRMVLVKPRLYLLFVGSPPDKPQTHAQEFVDSFKTTAVVQ